MAYRSLLVLLDGHPLCTARTDLAVRLPASCRPTWWGRPPPPTGWATVCWWPGTTAARPHAP